MKINPLLLTDYYKTEHHRMYAEGCTKIYSNLTPRKSRIEGIDSVVVFGIQYFIKKYLIEEFNKNFFSQDIKEIIKEYTFAVKVDTSHIEKLHSLGYLPIKIKALPEGTQCPIGVPLLTITNTHPEFFWLTNYLETLLSCTIWQPITTATIAHTFKKLLNGYALKTTGSISGTEYQGHDFSMRGMSSPESAITSGMGHLTSFVGTDSIPAIYALRDYYNANDPAGSSVPATEHSIMCLGTKDDEVGTFKHLMDLYPKGILSVVSDTWNLWDVLTKIMPQLRDQILSRDGKLVVRPDSGDPIDIICGPLEHEHSSDDWDSMRGTPELKGVIELLWDEFGGTVNEQGFKVLDSHVGAIYGDSINLERAQQICERLIAKGFATTNIVLGIGSYSYQYVTRDTFGFAVKATYGEVTHQSEDCPSTKECTKNGCQSKCCDWVEAREIFKDPITDDGTKKSKKGLLRVDLGTGKFNSFEEANKLRVFDQQTKEQEEQGLLETVFEDGKLIKTQTLSEIRNRLWNK